MEGAWKDRPVAQQETVAHPVRTVCQTVCHADPAVAHPTGLLAGPASQSGQGGAGRAAGGWTADDRPLSGRGRRGGGLDHRLYAVRLSLEYAQDQPKHLAVLTGDAVGLAHTQATTEKNLNLMSMGVFHCDPHPGNIFLTDDGRLALMDFGMVGRFDADQKDRIILLLLAFSERLGERVADTYLGMIEIPSDVVRSSLIQDYCAL